MDVYNLWRLFKWIGLFSFFYGIGILCGCRLYFGCDLDLIVLETIGSLRLYNGYTFHCRSIPWLKAIFFFYFQSKLF